jgi:hypothetical protein
MVPDVWAFPDAVERIDLASVGYEGRIEDEENRSLNQDADLENDSEDSEYEREDDPAAQTSVPWSGTPVDKAPQRLASKVDRDEANASEPAYAYDIQGCDVCGCV